MSRLYAVRPVIVFFAALWCALALSPYKSLDAFLERPYSTRFYDRNGVLLQITPLENGTRREYASSQTPDLLRKIVVFSEDRRFYWHVGIDLFAVLRAFFQNARAHSTVSGASTITMQLSRIISGYEGGMLGKIASAVDAMRIEARLSKKAILELYLSNVPFGRRTEGYLSAATAFFGKDAAFLTLSETCALAVIPRRPALYNPLVHPEENARAAFALGSAYIKSLPKKERAAFGVFEEASFDAAARSARPFSYPEEAPHLVRRFMTENPRPPSVVQLTLDLNMQKLAENLLQANIERYSGSRLSNGAVFAIHNETGEALIYAGSALFYDEAAQGQIDGVRALFQPGSSMKPFLYALALENGFLPSDVLADIPKTYGSAALYVPQNFNNRFNGPVLMRTALASSLNIPAVDLAERLGVSRYTEKLLQLGFESVRESAADAGLGIALGNAPISLQELVRAFSVFPNDGVLKPLVFTKSVGGREVGVVSKNGRVYDADSARIICSFLADRHARVLAFGRNTNFNTPFPSMWKTGTANQYQNIAALAATPVFTVGVWLGNFKGETVVGRTGSSIPAAIAREVLEALQGRESAAFKTPLGYSLSPVCALSGATPNVYCGAVLDEWLPWQTGLPMDAALPACSWHTQNGVVYPAEYQSWFLSRERNGELDYASSPLEIVFPKDGFELYAEGAAGGTFPLEVIGGQDDTLVVTYNGGEWTLERPFNAFLPLTRGTHTVTVRCGGEVRSASFVVK